MNTETTAPAAEAPECTQATQDAAVDAARSQATEAERTRITSLAELDATSSISERLSAAIEAGTSPGDFAIDLAKSAKAQRTAALADAKGDAVAGDQMPEQRTDASASTTRGNRGEAAVQRLSGVHPALPKQG